MNFQFLVVFQMCLFHEVMPSRASDRRIKRSSGPEARIIGGMDAPQGKYSFMAFVRVDITSSSPGACGGTILNDDTILTAAHCTVRSGEEVYNETMALVVAVGYADLEQAGKAVKAKQEVAYKVKSVHVHPIYRTGYVKFGYDLAVLKLEKKIKFSDQVTKVCLPQPHDQPDPSRCIALGWGRTNPDVLNSTTLKLQEAPLPLLPQDQCGQELNNYFKTVLKTRRYDFSSNKAMICGSFSEGGTLTCYGDSGGPLLCPVVGSSDSRLFQFGITSFGTSNKCNEKFDFFTNVRHYIDWIRQHSEH